MIFLLFLFIVSLNERYRYKITLLKIFIMIQQNPKLWLHKPKELSLLKYHPRFDLNQAEFLHSVRENLETQGWIIYHKHLLNVPFLSTGMVVFWTWVLSLLSNVHCPPFSQLLRLVVTLADEDANPTLDYTKINHSSKIANVIFIKTKYLCLKCIKLLLKTFPAQTSNNND